MVASSKEVVGVDIANRRTTPKRLKRVLAALLPEEEKMKAFLVKYRYGYDGAFGGAWGIEAIYTSEEEAQRLVDAELEGLEGEQLERQRLKWSIVDHEVKESADADIKLVRDSRERWQ